MPNSCSHQQPNQDHCSQSGQFLFPANRNTDFTMKFRFGSFAHKIKSSLRRSDLVQHHPVGVYLCISLRVQNDRLVLSEVSQGNFSIFWTGINGINDGVVIKILLTNITHTITCKEKQIILYCLRSNKEFKNNATTNASPLSQLGRWSFMLNMLQAGRGLI